MRLYIFAFDYKGIMVKSITTTGTHVMMREAGMMRCTLVQAKKAGKTGKCGPSQALASRCGCYIKE